MNSYELYEKLSEKYPSELSCVWDNDGIMVSPGPVSEVEKVLVCLDATEDALIYAAENGFDTVITHHPMIFSPLKNVTPETNVGRKAIFALMNGITVMSFHTRLDAAKGGVNDALAEALELSDVTSFGDAECPTMGRIGAADGFTVASFYEKVKEKLSGGAVCYTADGNQPCRKVAVLGGAGKDFIYAARDAGADVFVTGEASYNALLDAAENSVSVITAGHYETENPVCKKLKEALRELAPDVYVEALSGFNNSI